MGLVKNIFASKTQTLGHPRDPVIASFFGGRESAAGESVTPTTAMQTSAVLAAVRLLSETIASLLPSIYKKTGNNNKQEDKNHPLNEILSIQPNRFQTAFDFVDMRMGHILLHGNAYSEIISTPGRAVAELMPLHPDRVRPFVAPDGKVAYFYMPMNGESRTILGRSMLHHKGLPSSNPANSMLEGKSVISFARESVGISLAADKFAGRFFANDATPSGIIKHPSSFKDKESFDNFKRSWQAAQTGDNRHKTAVLENGMDYESIGLNNKDSQFLELRQYQITDIARVFRLPPHTIGSMDKATFNTLEQQDKEFVVSSIRPWVVRSEQTMNAKLLSPLMRKTHFIGFNLNDLMRGDSKARALMYKTRFATGSITPNEIRGQEGMNKLPGPEGDKTFLQLNLTTAESLVTDGGKSAKISAFFKSAAGRMALKEANAVNRIRRGENIDERIDEFYASHVACVADALLLHTSVVETYFKNQAIVSKKNDVVVEERTAEIIKLWGTP